MSKIRQATYKQPTPAGARQMTPEHRQLAAQSILLINHHRSLAAQMEARLATVLQEAYGVDIQSGQWRINMDTGAITPTETVP